MPASSAIFASQRLSGQVPDQRSGTLVTARPDEQLAPNKPIFSALPPCIIRRGDNVEFAICTIIPQAPLNPALRPGAFTTPIAKMKSRIRGSVMANFTVVRRAFLLGASCIAMTCLAAPGTALADSYPSKPVKIIIPFPAGGVTDIAGRMIAQRLSEKLGQQFFIENVSGAGGNIGMEKVAHAPGDGYTVLLSSSSVTVNPSLYAKMPFDVEKELIPVTKAGGSPNSWLVNPEFPAKTMKEL